MQAGSFIIPKNDLFQWYYLRNLDKKSRASVLKSQLPKHHLSEHHQVTVFFVIPYQYKGIDSYQSDTVAASDSQASLVYLHIALPMTEC